MIIWRNITDSSVSIGSIHSGIPLDGYKLFHSRLVQATWAIKIITHNIIKNINDSSLL